METLPAVLGVAFALITGLSLWLFYRAAQPSRRMLYVLAGWLLLQGALALSGFYAAAPQSVPPRLVFAVVPPALLIIGCLFFAGRRAYLDRISLEALTLLHIVRFPVELVLLGLFIQGGVPQLMTFEGRNWDIFSGLSAPLVYYLVFKRELFGPKTLLCWNIICLGLLLNVVTIAMLSVPSPMQQLSFEQPNTAVLYFPFIWLPACVVPLVLFGHVAAIRQLIHQLGHHGVTAGKGISHLHTSNARLSTPS